MKYTKLGNSDLTVSRICMGCMGFGDAGRGQHSWTLDEEHSREIIKRGLDLGVNFFDTAIAYQSGTSEQFLGRAIRDFAKRDEVVIATKFLPRTPEEIAVSVAAELISVLNAADPGEGFPPGMAEELAADPSGVLAMIVEKSGEAPRRPGTKMLVRTDGSFLGTVGGGYAEAEILKTARQMIAEGDRKSRTVRITMKKGTMHCGGEVAVFLTAV